jgi:hypothetical protein
LIATPRITPEPVLALAGRHPLLFLHCRTLPYTENITAIRRSRGKYLLTVEDGPAGDIRLIEL